MGLLNVVVVVATGVIAWLTWYLFNLLQTGRQLAPIPSPPIQPGLFNRLLGHLSYLTETNQYHRVTLKWSQDHGAVCKLRFLNNYVVLITDPAIATDMMRDKSLDKSKRGYTILNALFTDTGHNGLLTSQMNAQWKAVRRAVASALSPQSLRATFPQLRAVGQRVVQRISQHGGSEPIDMDLLCAQLSWDIIGLVGFNTDMGATKGPMHSASSSIIATVRTGMQEIEERWGQPYRAQLWKYLLPSARKGQRDLEAVHSIIRDLLLQLRKQDPASFGNTIAGQLLNLKDPATGQPMTDDQLQPEIGTMFLAGFETSGHTEAWALYLISQHPEVEQRILQELAEHGLMPSPTGSLRDIQFEDLGRLTYLNCCIKEALRLYPAAPSTDRIAPRDMYVGGYFIPKGTTFWISLYAMQTLGSLHDDPTAFKPERWFDADYMYCQPAVKSAALKPLAHQSPGHAQEGLADKASSDSEQSTVSLDESWVHVAQQSKSEDVDGKQANRPKRWFPFSDGPRSCVGLTLANMNMTSTLATLLAHFHFRLADQMGGAMGVQDSESVAITLAPSHGMFMHAEPRAKV